MREDTEVSWEEVPESGLEELPDEEDTLGEELSEKEGRDSPHRC